MTSAVVALRRTGCGTVYNVPLRCMRYTLGRSGDCDIFIDEPTISRIHCIIERRHDDSLIVIATGATNRTEVDGIAVTSTSILANAGILTLGAIELRAESAIEPAPRLVSPPTTVIPLESRNFYEVVEFIESWKPRRRAIADERAYSASLAKLLRSRFPMWVDHDSAPRPAMRRSANRKPAIARSRFVSKLPPALMRLGIVRRRPDITITSGDTDSLIYVELKLDLLRPAEMERLGDQIRDLLCREEPPLRRLIVLLLGETRPSFVDQLLEDEEDTRAPLPENDVPSRRLRIVQLPF